MNCSDLLLYCQYENFVDNTGREIVLDFTVMIAEVPARIRCRHQETRSFLSPYLTAVDPAFTIEPTKADLQQIQLDLIRTAEAEGQPVPPQTRTFNLSAPKACSQLCRNSFSACLDSILCIPIPPF